MDFRKGEGPRYKQGSSCGREDHSIHPELLCDVDILFWRDPEHRFSGREAEVEGLGYDNHVNNVRNNDVPDPRTIQDLFNRTTYQFRSHI